MSKKSKKTAKSTVVKTAAPKPPKPEIERAVVSRKTYTWTERALMRAEKAGRLINRLAITIASAKPPGFDELFVYVPETPTSGPLLGGSLGIAYEVTQSILTRLAALPGDFKPPVKKQHKSGVEVGSTVGVAAEHENNDVFAHIPAALFELAKVLGEDGKVNWLVKCTDGVVRTIRKMYVEPVSEEDESADSEDEDTDDEQLDDE